MVSLSSAVGCSFRELTDPNEVPDSAKESSLNVRFTTAQPETKTAFGGMNEADGTYPAYWTANDQYISMSLNYAEPVQADVIKETPESSSAEFSATFEDGGKPYEFYAFSPISAMKAISDSRKSWMVTVPAVQTPRADGLSCDESAMLLYAKSASYEVLPTTPIELNFSHVTTYCRLKLKNLATSFQNYSIADATVASVDLTYSVPVAGDWFVNAADGTLEAWEPSHTISLQSLDIDPTQPTDLWYALIPCKLDGQTIKVTVNTSKGAISREYTFGTRTYEPGAVNKLTLDMTKNVTYDSRTRTEEEVVYQLVTSASDLAVNDEVVFVNATTPAYALTATNDGSNGIKAVAKDAANGFTYSTADKFVRLPEGSGVAVLTVASKSGTSVTFKNGSMYLAYSGTSSNSYPSFSASATTFTLGISNGEAILTFRVSGKTRYLAYNSDHFKFSTTSGKFAIFKKITNTATTVIDLDNDPVLQQEEYGAYLADASLVHTIGITQLSREYHASSVTFAIMIPDDYYILEFTDIPVAAAKGDAFSMDLKVRDGKKPGIVGTYGVTVVKEDGAKLWLSDFDGNGFIVKR